MKLLNLHRNDTILGEQWPIEVGFSEAENRHLHLHLHIHLHLHGPYGNRWTEDSAHNCMNNSACMAVNSDTVDTYYPFAWPSIAHQNAPFPLPPPTPIAHSHSPILAPCKCCRRWAQSAKNQWATCHGHRRASWQRSGTGQWARARHRLEVHWKKSLILHKLYVFKSLWASYRTSVNIILPLLLLWT